MQVHGIHMSSRSLNCICIFTIYSLEIQLRQILETETKPSKSQPFRVTHETSMYSAFKPVLHLEVTQSEMIRHAQFLQG